MNVNSAVVDLCKVLYDFQVVCSLLLDRNSVLRLELSWSLMGLSRCTPELKMEICITDPSLSRDGVCDGSKSGILIKQFSMRKCMRVHFPFYFNSTNIKL